MIRVGENAAAEMRNGDTDEADDAAVRSDDAGQDRRDRDRQPTGAARVDSDAAGLLVPQ